MEPFTVVAERCRLPRMKLLWFSWTALSIGWIGSLYLRGSVKVVVTIPRLWWRRI